MFSHEMETPMDDSQVDLAERLGRLERANNALVERLQRSEKVNRRLGRCGIIATVGAILIIGGGADVGGVSKVVEAQKFILRDKNNSVRGIWEVKDDVAFFLLSGKKRFQDAVSIVADADGNSAFRLLDRDGLMRVVLSIGPDGESSMGILDRDGGSRIKISSDVDCNFPSIVFFDKEGKRRVLLSNAPNGTPFLQLLDRDKNRLFEVPKGIDLGED
jgi:hypothetical protein